MMTIRTCLASAMAALVFVSCMKREEAYTLPCSRVEAELPGELTPVSIVDMQTKSNYTYQFRWNSGDKINFGYSNDVLTQTPASDVLSNSLSGNKGKFTGSITVNQWSDDAQIYAVFPAKEGGYSIKEGKVLNVNKDSMKICSGEHEFGQSLLVASREERVPVPTAGETYTLPGVTFKQAMSILRFRLPMVLTEVEEVNTKGGGSEVTKPDTLEEVQLLAGPEAFISKADVNLSTAEIFEMERTNSIVAELTDTVVMDKSVCLNIPVYPVALPIYDTDDSGKLKGGGGSGDDVVHFVVILKTRSIEGTKYYVAECGAPYQQKLVLERNTINTVDVTEVEKYEDLTCEVKMSEYTLPVGKCRIYSNHNETDDSEIKAGETFQMKVFDENDIWFRGIHPDTVRIFDSGDEEVATLSVASGGRCEIEEGIFSLDETYRMELVFPDDPIQDRFKIFAPTGCGLTITKDDQSYEDKYSIQFKLSSDDEWTMLNFSSNVSMIHIPSGEYAEFLGTVRHEIEPSGYDPNAQKGYFCFSSNNAKDSLVLSGNIMSLIRGDDSTASKVSPYCFSCLFAGAGCHIDASKLKLPDSTAMRCYNRMFYTAGLRSAPTLPAMILAESCYWGMFESCRNLTVAPDLPAQSMVTSCYENMFAGCVNLKSAPALPAMNLAKSCYQSMFRDCDSLKTTPVLSAVNLAESCYKHMFSGCSGLKTACALPAQSMVTSCYEGMFLGCEALTEAPSLTSSNNPPGCMDCYKEMFHGCTKLDSLVCDIDCDSLWLTNNANYIVRSCGDGKVIVPTIERYTPWVKSVSQWACGSGYNSWGSWVIYVKDPAVNFKITVHAYKPWFGAVESGKTWKDWMDNCSWLGMLHVDSDGYVYHNEGEESKYKLRKGEQGTGSYMKASDVVVAGDDYSWEIVE